MPPETTQPAERFVHPGDIALNVADWGGDGPAMLLVHGWGGSTAVWDTVAPLLAKDFHVQAVDLRGFGRSGRVTAGHVRDTWARDTVNLLRKVAPDGAHIIGHSLGGWVSLMVGAMEPELALSIVAEDPYTGEASLVGSRSTNDRGSDYEGEARFLESARSIEPLKEKIAAANDRYSPELVEKLAILQFRTDPALIRGRGTRLEQRNDFTAEFKKIKAPTLILQANPEKGGIMPDEEARRVKGLIPDCEVVSWPHTGHNMHIARNFDFVKAVNRFLRPD
jgi:pimeloyl-ACP methyl ester carboxylesterase